MASGEGKDRWDVLFSILLAILCSRRSLHLHAPHSLDKHLSAHPPLERHPRLLLPRYLPLPLAPLLLLAPFPLPFPCSSRCRSHSRQQSPHPLWQLSNAVANRQFGS